MTQEEQEEFDERASGGEEACLEVGEDDDEDGLGTASSPISVDKQYLGETAADEDESERGSLSQAVQQWKVQHSAGDFKYPGKLLEGQEKGWATTNGLGLGLGLSREIYDESTVEGFRRSAGAGTSATAMYHELRQLKRGIQPGAEGEQLQVLVPPGLPEYYWATVTSNREEERAAVRQHYDIAPQMAGAVQHQARKGHTGRHDKPDVPARGKRDAREMVYCDAPEATVNGCGG